MGPGVENGEGIRGVVVEGCKEEFEGGRGGRKARRRGGGGGSGEKGKGW